MITARVFVLCNDMVQHAPGYFDIKGVTQMIRAEGFPVTIDEMLLCILSDVRETTKLTVELLDASSLETIGRREVGGTNFNREGAAILRIPFSHQFTKSGLYIFRLCEGAEIAAEWDLEIMENQHSNS